LFRGNTDINFSFLSDNVLVDGDTALICDFGMTRMATSALSRTQVGGTPLYQAPELILAQKRQGGAAGAKCTEASLHLSSDIWSLGYVLWEIYHEERIYSAYRSTQEIFMAKLQYAENYLLPALNGGGNGGGGGGPSKSSSPPIGNMPSLSSSSSRRLSKLIRRPSTGSSAASVAAASAALNATSGGGGDTPPYPLVIDPDCPFASVIAMCWTVTPLQRPEASIVESRLSTILNHLEANKVK
jgi:serine/threonine protein kinase